jgi:hypothetical protein
MSLTASFRQFFQPRGHVYPITMDGSALYDIPDVDAHPELDPPICWYLRTPLGHCALDPHGAAQGIDGTNKKN